MKILKYLLFGIVAILLIFFAVGLMSPSVSYGHEISVDKPLEEAWAVSQDEAKYGLWLEGFKSMELLSGEKGEVGSTYKVIVNPGEGQEDFEMIETLVSLEELDHVTMDFESEMMDFKQSMRFAENKGITRIWTESEVMANGLVMRSMFAWMEMLAGVFESQEAKNMEALKKVIEANETDYQEGLGVAL